VLEAASAAGAEFSAAAIAAALEHPTHEVEMRCVQLARQQQSIDSSGASEWPDGTISSRFRFHHWLYGDVLYNRLPVGRRIELHRRIAEREETAYGARADEIAAELVHHYGEARDGEKAVKSHQIAGKQAVKRSANREAVTHFSAALQILESFPQTEEVIRQKLRLHVFLQTPLIVSTGYTSAEVKEVCERARSLARQLKDSPELFAVLGGLCSIHLNRGELKIAFELGQESMRIAEGSNNPVMLLWAHYALGFALEALGEYQQSREQLERSVALYDRTRGGSYGFVQDPGPTGLLMLAVVVCKLGFLDLAWRHASGGLKLARELGHSFTLGWVLNTAIFIRAERGELDEAAALSEESVILCTRLGFDELLEGALVWQGVIMVRRGEAQGIARIQEGLAIAKSARRAANLGLLSQGYRRLGNTGLGLATVVEALASLNEEDRCLVPWLLRLKGDLLLGINPPDNADAECLFCESIEVARSQSDKLEELETTISLSRVIAKREPERARAMLSEIYNWFTEGFDTAPLKEAKALLDHLSEPPPRPKRSRKTERGLRQP
jgi:tetratricopeptide (TPR) repeat protein